MSRHREEPEYRHDRAKPTRYAVRPGRITNGQRMRRLAREAMNTFQRATVLCKRRQNDGDDCCFDAAQEENGVPVTRRTREIMENADSKRSPTVSEQLKKIEWIG